VKQLKPVGRDAASRKYDILTALGTHACQGGKHLQRLVLRFITLIVARYNWQGDDLSVGQRDIATLWGVDERTVKRDMAKLRDLGWLVVKRPAARGRVALHGLGLDRILEVTEPHWSAVGSDFQGRMQQGRATATPQIAATNVVTFPRATALPDDATVWNRVRFALETEDPALFNAWFRALREGSCAADHVHLIAPTRFHANFVTTHHGPRLLAAFRREGLAKGGLLVTAD
jgi:hypothetical protein